MKIHLFNRRALFAPAKEVSNAFASSPFDLIPDIEDGGDEEGGDGDGEKGDPEISEKKKAKEPKVKKAESPILKNLKKVLDEEDDGSLDGDGALDDDEEEEEAKKIKKKLFGDKDKKKKEDDDEENNEEDDEEEDKGEDEEEDGGEDDDVKNLRNSKGEKISPKVGEQIKEFKARMKKKIADLEKENGELKLKKPDALSDEERKELTRLREEVGSIEFESSEEYKETYVKPVSESIAKVNSLFAQISEDFDEESKEDTIKACKDLFAKAQSFAVAGDEGKFSKMIDAIIDETDLGKSAARKLETRMEAWFEAQQSLNEIRSEKLEKRKTAVEDLAKRSRFSKSKGISKEIDDSVTEYKTRMAHVIERLPDEAKAELLAFEKEIPDVRADLAAFSATGEMSPRIKKIIKSGVTASAVEYSAKMAWAAWKDSSNKIKILEEQQSDLIERLKRATGETEISLSKYSPKKKSFKGKDKKDVEKGGSRIADNYKKILEEEDE